MDPLKVSQFVSRCPAPREWRTSSVRHTAVKSRRGFVDDEAIQQVCAGLVRKEAERETRERAAA